MSSIVKKIYIVLSIVLLTMLFGCSKEPQVVIEKYETTENASEDVMEDMDNIDDNDTEDTMDTIEESVSLEEDTHLEAYEEISKKKGENKMVVTYCTFSGYTKKIAKMIENYYHKKGKVVDLYEIEPKVAYTEKDLDYMDKNSRCSKEHDGDLRPELLDNDFNIDKHEVVFVGFPVWWGLSPQIVYTFLESYDFNGKTIVPFCTSHSSPLSNACDNLKKYTDANVLPGIRFSMEVKEDEVEKWLDGLKFQ